jgi:HEAT repeat protein
MFKHICPIRCAEHIAAEFRDFIQVSIPHITDLLQDDNYLACEAAATTLGKFSKQGRIFIQSAVAYLNRSAAEFRQAIKASIPSIVNLLKDNSWTLRCIGAEVLAQLSEHGRRSVGRQWRS